MYNKFRNFSLVGLPLLLAIAGVFPDIANANNPGSFMGLYVLTLSVVILSYALALIGFLVEGKFRHPGVLDIALILPPIICVLIFILAVVFGIDVTNLR